MATEDRFDVAKPSAYRPAMMNGFWKEGERDRAEAAAAELRGLGLGERQISFSTTNPRSPIEYSSGGGLRSWIRGKLSRGAADPEPEGTEEPVVLMTWPEAGQADRVCEIMNRHGADKVNSWEAQGAR